MVEVRRRRWCVTQVDASSLLEKLNETQHLVFLESLEEDALGEELQVIWELEAGAQVIQKAGLPNITDIAPNHRLDAFLDAVRWGAPRPMRTGTTSSRHSAAASPLRTISLTRLSVRWTWRV